MESCAYPSHSHGRLMSKQVCLKFRTKNKDSELIWSLGFGTLLHQPRRDQSKNQVQVKISCRHYLSQYFIQFFEESSDGISLFANNRAISKVKATDVDIQHLSRYLRSIPSAGSTGLTIRVFTKKMLFTKNIRN